MTPEQMDRVFEALGGMAVLDKAHEERLAGNRRGIGLFSAKELMLSMGGDLFFDREQTRLGGGTCIVVRLPLSSLRLAGEEIAHEASGGLLADSPEITHSAESNSPLIIS